MDVGAEKVSAFLLTRLQRKVGSFFLGHARRFARRGSSRLVLLQLVEQFVAEAKILENFFFVVGRRGGFRFRAVTALSRDDIKRSALSIL